MKKIVMCLMVLWPFVSFGNTQGTKTYLPFEVSGTIFTFSTEGIPEQISVTVICDLSKINKQSPKRDSYIFVYPYSNQFSSIVKNSRYSPIELGGKIYKESSDGKNFSFRINGVTQSNKAIVIDTRREGRHALEGSCYY
ncbi:MAG: hypothetical protein P1U36_06880 [Legionellaceae bacterium]|nr:hypothetical protein [Legionellaceae bacterium]